VRGGAILFFSVALAFLMHCTIVLLFVIGLLY
jgi:hypothetical protein